MLTPDQIDRCDALWRRLYARGGVRWMPGMSCVWARPGGAGGQQFMPSQARIADLPMGPLPTTYCVVDVQSVYKKATPVWTDPATIGCLVAMAREATGDAEATCVVYGGRWHCDWHGNESIAETEPEALLRAIKEAAR